MATMTLVEKHDFRKGSAEYKEPDKTTNFVSCPRIFTIRVFTRYVSIFSSQKNFCLTIS